MFPSVCSLRSARCAALIALATVAGIARFEPSSPSQTDADPTSPASSLTAPRHRTHLHPCVLLAHFVRFYRNAFFPPALPCSTPGERLALAAYVPPHGWAPGTPPSPSWPTGLAASPRPFAHAPDVSPLSVRRYLIPFPVGPPAQPTTPPHRADGTSVRPNLSARCPCAPSVALVRLFPVARPARRSFSGQPLTAGPFRPSSALRGEPAPLPDPVRFPPPLGASGRRGPHLFPFAL
jgi:hypothetical protein